MVLGEHYRMHSDVKLLSLELMGLFGEMEVFLNENSEFDDRETVLDLYFKIRDFLYKIHFLQIRCCRNAHSDITIFCIVFDSWNI